MDGKGHLGMAVASSVIYLEYFSSFKFYHHADYFYILYHSPTFYTVLGFLIAIFAGKLPDYDLYLVNNPSDWRERVRYHRQITHSLLLGLVALVYLLYLKGGEEPADTLYIDMFGYFVFGFLSHIVADILTGTVPIFLWADNRKTWLRIGIRINGLKTFFVSLGVVLSPVFVIAGIYDIYTVTYAKNQGIIHQIIDKISLGA